MSEPETITEADDGILADIGERIKLARQCARMTQEALAEKLGMTPTAVSYWEAGKRDMGVAALLRIADACGVPASLLLPPEHREQTGTDGAVGRWAEIAFMGRNEHTGYVTEITKNGQAAYHVDLPGKVWGGNPHESVEYAATAWFSERSVTEDYVRRAWESKVRAAEKRRQQEAEWARMQEQRAIEAGSDHDPDEDPTDDEDGATF